MERFTYLATFVSLILGLGVANILSQLSALAKRRATVDWYWVHTVFCVTFFVSMAGEWWILLVWAQHPPVGYYVYLSFLIKPSILYFASDLLFPEDPTAPGIDLKQHYFDVRPVFCGVMMLYPFADVLDTLLKGTSHLIDLGPRYWILMPALFLVWLGGIFIKRERYHATLAIIGLIMVLIGFVSSGLNV